MAPTPIRPRPTQTKVKHIILEKYIGAWGGIITGSPKMAAQAARQGQQFDLHLVYVDCNASSGRFDGEQEDAAAGRKSGPVFGSPIIGVRALDKLAGWAKEKRQITVRTNAILIEKERAEYTELQRSLDMAGLKSRLKYTDDFSSLHNGEIAVLRADSTELASQLTDYTQANYTFSLYFLDPYGPKAIPLRFVEQIVGKRRQDVIINMPYQDLHKKTGLATRLNLTPQQQEVVGHFDAMFRNRRWQAIAQRLIENDLWDEDPAFPEPTIDVGSAPAAADLEMELVAEYKNALQSVDKDLIVKSIALHFPASTRTMFYLYLTTHDADGALSMNEILWEAGYQEDELRWRLFQAKEQQARQMQLLSGFDNLGPLPPKVRQVNTEQVVTRLRAVVGRQPLTRKDIYRAMADEPYFAPEINKALNYMKKQGRAEFQPPLKNSSLVTIL